MAGRKPGYRHSEDMRTHIKTGMLIKRLHDHVNSKTPILDASQVNAAKALLNKVLPDLQSVQSQIDGSMSLTIASKEQRDASVAAASRADR